MNEPVLVTPTKTLVKRVALKGPDRSQFTVELEPADTVDTHLTVLRLYSHSTIIFAIFYYFSIPFPCFLAMSHFCDFVATLHFLSYGIHGLLPYHSSVLFLLRVFVHCFRHHTLSPSYVSHLRLRRIAFCDAHRIHRYCGHRIMDITSCFKLSFSFLWFLRSYLISDQPHGLIFDHFSFLVSPFRYISLCFDFTGHSLCHRYIGLSAVYVENNLWNLWHPSEVQPFAFSCAIADKSHFSSHHLFVHNCRQVVSPTLYGSLTSELNSRNGDFTPFHTVWLFNTRIKWWKVMTSHHAAQDGSPAPEFSGRSGALTP